MHASNDSHSAAAGNSTLRHAVGSGAPLQRAVGCWLGVAASLALVGSGAAAEVTAAAAHLQPVTDAMLRSPADSDWLMWRRTYDGWGYSPLRQINGRNVSKLRLAWARALPAGIQEGTPLAFQGLLLMPSAGGGVQAFDAQAGTLKWAYRRPAPGGTESGTGRAQRAISVYGTSVFVTTPDDHVVALDMASGAPKWDTEVLDNQALPASISGGTLVVRGMVISGRGCALKSAPGACALVALDAESGAKLWNTSPIATPDDPNNSTWGKVPYEQRHHVAAWMLPSYDAKLDLLYFGTSDTSPEPKFLLAGNDNTYLYHDSTLAITPRDGKIAWYYQHFVDHWDLDSTFERYLIDTAVRPDREEVAWINPRLKRSEQRRVVTGIPGKTGIVYTLDAASGEFLWARPTTRQTVIDRIDGTTGKAFDNPDALFTELGQKHFLCPSPGGGKDWPAGAYSPLTHAMYFPLQNTCAEYMATATAVTTVQAAVPGESNVGNVFGIAVDSGKTLWRYRQRAATNSLVATGGGLLFGGDDAGHFRAFDQKSGKVVWEVNLGSAVSGYPISFSVAGKQFVAVATGPSLISGLLLRLTPDLETGQGSNLFVFSLP
jgi:alcohol dehydrogenase (cytochrome c)